MSRIGIVLTGILVLLVAGCGGQPASTPVAVATPLSSPASVAVATGTAPVAPPTATSAGVTATQATVSVAIGLTEDGHHFWGAPDAPLTMIDYSDFM